MARTAAEPKYRFNRKGDVVRDARRRDSDGVLVPRHSSIARLEYHASHNRRSDSFRHQRERKSPVPQAAIDALAETPPWIEAGHQSITSWHEDRNELPQITQDPQSDQRAITLPLAKGAVWSKMMNAGI